MTPEGRDRVRLGDALAVCPVVGCALSPDGRFAAAHVLRWDAQRGTRDPVLEVLAIDEGRWRPVGHEEAVLSGASFAADGRLVALRQHGPLVDAVILDPNQPDAPPVDVVGLPPMASAPQWFDRPGRLACTGLDGAGVRRLWVWDDPGQKPRVASPAGLPVGAVTFAFGSERHALRIDPPRRIGDDDPEPVVLVAGRLGEKPRPLAFPEPVRGSIAWSPDGRWLGAITRPAGAVLAQPRLWVVDSRSGAARCLVDGQDGWLTQFDWTHDSAAVLASVERGLRGRLLRLGLDGTVVDVAPEAGFVNAAACARDSARFVHLRQDLDDPQHLALREPDSRASARVSDFDRVMRSRVLAPVEEVAWRASDGTTIEALLLTPARTPAPVVVWLHGGPAEHLQRTFSAYFQLFVAEGYAVLAPNFRGSTGRDDAFLRGSVHRLGEVDRDDVLAGIDALAGRIDPRRVAFVGWSYGATLALLCGAARPGTRAVVAGAPVADWVTAFGAPSWPWVTRHYFPTAPWDDAAPYDRASPVRQLGSLTAPTLLFHGEADDRVPSSHPRLLLRLLQARGVPVDLRWFPGEGHVFGAPWAIREMLARTVGWLDTHLRP